MRPRQRGVLLSLLRNICEVVMKFMKREDRIVECSLILHLFGRVHDAENFVCLYSVHEFDCLALTFKIKMYDWNIKCLVHEQLVWLSGPLKQFVHNYYSHIYHTKHYFQAWKCRLLCIRLWSLLGPRL